MKKKLFFKRGGNRYWIEIIGNKDISGWAIMQTNKSAKGLGVEKYFLMREVVKGSDLELVHLALDPVEGIPINVEEIEGKDLVSIWTSEFFKDQFLDDDGKWLQFSDRYDEYYDKRWDEMPNVRLTIKAWNDLQRQWAQIKKDKPRYIMIELDDSGRNDPAVRDKVTITPKDELSQEDLDYIKQEHEKYLKYQAAKQKYIDNHPDYSEVWRGPQDDEYEADIMKYYED